jgi:hypothetical protein
MRRQCSQINSPRISLERVHYPLCQCVRHIQRD